MTPSNPRTALEHGSRVTTWCIGLAAFMAAGCTTAPTPIDATTLRGFDGGTGAPIDWSTVVLRANEVDVVLFGEEHDDPFAHALQRSLLESMLDESDRTALSMEMLERSEQDVVDRWANGEIDRETFMEETGAGSWGGVEGWIAWYQPILDEGRRGRARIVAANAPRKFVRSARIDGYEALEALAPEDRSLFDLPTSLEQGGYWTRFRDTMRDYRGDDVEDAEIIATFRSQMTWDSTMAGSIATAFDREDVERILHLAGRFHIDLEGGTVRELRRLRPEASIMTVSCVRAGLDADVLSDDDVDRADIVIYTPIASDRVTPSAP